MMDTTRAKMLVEMLQQAERGLNTLIRMASRIAANQSFDSEQLAEEVAQRVCSVIQGLIEAMNYNEVLPASLFLAVGPMWERVAKMEKTISDLESSVFSE